MKKEEKVSVQEKRTIEGLKFYPDVEFNRKERKKALILGILLIVLMGGMGISILIGGRAQGGDTMTFIMGAATIAVMVFAVAMIPNAFKQYPVKNEPILEIRPKEAVINGTTYKMSDVLEVRLTITVGEVSRKKEENEAYINSLLAKEPERGITANVDVAVKDKGDKSKTLFTTVKNGYEALVAFYKAGIKRYSIVYSMKKISKQATFDLGDSETEDGVKLSQVSKKDRLKQLY